MSALIARMGIRSILWLLLAGSFVACTLAWIGSAKFADERLKNLLQYEREQAQSDAELVSANLDLRLAQVLRVAQTLAQDPAIQNEMARFGPHVQASPLPLTERGEIWRADPALKPLAQRLAHMLDKFDLTTLWVTNAAGDTVAEGHSAEAKPFTGTNYADRDYFKAAQQGQDGRQFVVGRITNVYGLYFSSPVQVDSQFVGMVGAGLAISKIRSTIERVNAVVTDDMGVIVLAKDPALLMQTMPGSTVSSLSAQERERRYKRNEFTAVDIRPAAAQGLQSLYRWRSLEQPHAIESHPTSDGALRVYILRDLGEPLSQNRRDQVWWFGLVCMLVLLLAALVAGAMQFVTAKQKQQSALQDLNEVLSRQANTDALTGCANRRHFINALEHERDRSARYRANFCVLSMDIDHFKRVNDTYGHAAGDEVLKHFVATVQSNLRESDTLGRVGGEEFSVLLPQTQVDGAAVIAERIRASVEATAAVLGTTSLTVTVSIGGVQWEPDSNQPVHELMAQADEALYYAKNGGRNRVQWAQLPATQNKGTISQPAG